MTTPRTHALRAGARWFEAASPNGGRSLEACALRCGEDVVVVICGGARHHVGAAALCLSLPSLKDPARPTHSTYLVAVPGHKEEDLAREASRRLSRALGTNVVVTVGIHDDGLTPEGIREYVALHDGLVERIAAELGSPPPGPA